MSETPLDYPKLVERAMQGAMRGVVRDVLAEVAQNGLPAGHHFYLAFETGADGVELADSLRAQYPEEMTIVVQHQFWDLEVEHDWFAVTLSFQGRPERLRVPFEALKSFFDPDVKFGLQFKPDQIEAEPQEKADGESEAAEPAAGEVVALDAFRKKT